MLWVDKHAPRRLDDLSCHANLTPQLRGLAASDSPPHLLFYGPSGAGKKTRALALLREMFGDEVDRVRVETFVEKESNAEATVCQSSCHIILSCTEFGLRDRAIVQAVVKSLVEAAPQAALASSFFSKAKKQKRFKVVVLQDADVLTEGAQHALRRSLETHVGSLKFFLLATNAARITGPLKSRWERKAAAALAAATRETRDKRRLRSIPSSYSSSTNNSSRWGSSLFFWLRCLGLRVPLPPTQEVVQVLRETALKEETPAELVPEAMLQQVCLFSGRNVRASLLSLQSILTHCFAAATPAAGPAATNPQKLQQLMQYGSPNCPFPAPWEAVADEIAAKIARAPSVRTLQECRGCFYELLAALIPPDLVLLRIIRSLFFVKPGVTPPDTSLSLSSSSSSNNSSSNAAAAAAAAAAKYRQQGTRRLLLIEAVGDAALAAHGLQRGSKPIFHLEAFAASAMRRFKGFQETEALKHRP